MLTRVGYFIPGSPAINDTEYLELQIDLVFFSSFTLRSHGVAILVRKNTPFKITVLIRKYII